MPSERGLLVWDVDRLVRLAEELPSRLVPLADDAGCAFGGHLAPGTIVFACEFCVHVLDGPDLCRGVDDETGLPLWEM